MPAAGRKPASGFAMLATVFRTMNSDARFGQKSPLFCRTIFTLETCYSLKLNNINGVTVYSRLVNTFVAIDRRLISARTVPMFTCKSPVSYKERTASLNRVPVAC